MLTRILFIALLLLVGLAEIALIGTSNILRHAPKN